MTEVFLLQGARRVSAWGSTTAIQEFLGQPPDGVRLAELWFGTHPDGDAFVPSRSVGLGGLIAADPRRLLGADVADRFGELPFLVKLLAAERALSIQVHPDRAQATEGFEREERLGIPRNAPMRNYRDRNHKPELLCALTEFEALCGFRPVEQTLRLLDYLGVPELAHVAGLLQQPDGLRAAVTHLVSLDDPAPLVHRVVAAAGALEPPPAFAGPLKAVLQTGADFPGDAGVLLTLLLNHVALRPGEAIFLGAGNVHAYLHGLGVEVMAASDNVLRAGLTPKHVDVDDLLAVTDFTPLTEPRVGQPTAWGARYPVPVEDFALARVDLTAAFGRAPLHRLPNPGPAVVLCTEGAAEIDACGTPEALHRGQVAFVPDSREVSLRGEGTVMVVTAGATG